ncbi:SDR family NAD(P)-dependent oxidoreductase [Streptomyces sp. NPDC088925]|uniref:SDR family NAD(P)-dependent oxidoreductase n=1 Tax=Streptomyces sp. NPDC088925 TaxID=3365914 RepID=UPI0038188CE0
MSRQQVTVVTGGSRGIGAAVVARLADEGHHVAVGYHAGREAAEAVAEDARARGVKAVAIGGDTADEADVERLFDEAAGALGPVTGLVNNAGVSGPIGRLVDADAAGMRRALDVNVLGCLLCARRAVRDWERDGIQGAIVNISSGAATLGSPGEYIHYAASKAAVDALTIGLSKEVGPSGIRVNSVAPGAVVTDFHPDPERPARMAAGVPLRRIGELSEIAAAVAWFLSPESSYATGAILRVTGGR